MLVVVERDPDDKNFLIIAWACVKNESKHNWSWFLTLLQSKLDLVDGSNHNLNYDMHKVRNLQFMYVI